LAGSQNTGLGTNQPQFNRLSATTDLVTIGFGANDSALGTEAGVACISLLSFPSASCKTATDNAIGRIPAIEANFVAAIGQIRAISPNAQIFVVNYLASFPSSGCWPLVPVNITDMGRVKTAWTGSTR